MYMTWPNDMASRTSASKKDQYTTREFVFSLTVAQDTNTRDGRTETQQAGNG